MPGRFGPTYVSAFMDQVALAELHMALFFDDPLATTLPTTYEIGGLVTRQESTWERAGYNTLQLTSKVVFDGIEPGTSLVAVGAFDDPFAGELVFRELFRDIDGNPEPRAFPAGGGFVIPAGEFVVGLDVSFSLPD